jgi:hypothetical protein
LTPASAQHFCGRRKLLPLHPSQKTVLPTCDEGGARPRHPCIAADAEAPAAGGAGIKSRGARRRVLSGSILLFTKPPRGAQTTRGRSVQEGGKVTFLLPVFCRAPHHQSGNCATTVAPSSRQDPSAATAADMCPPTQTLVAARACVTLTPSKRTGKARERWRDATKRGGLHCLPVRVECTGASICKLCLDQSETTRKYDRAQDSYLFTANSSCDAMLRQSMVCEPKSLFVSRERESSIITIRLLHEPHTESPRASTSSDPSPFPPRRCPFPGSRA